MTTPHGILPGRRSPLPPFNLLNHPDISTEKQGCGCRVGEASVLRKSGLEKHRSHGVKFPQGGASEWCTDVRASESRRNAQYACTESVRASMWNRLVPHAQYADLVFAVPSSWIRRVRFFRLAATGAARVRGRGACRPNVCFNGRGSQGRGRRGRAGQQQ